MSKALTLPIKTAFCASLALCAGIGAGTGPALAAESDAEIIASDAPAEERVDDTHLGLGLMGTVPIYWGEADSLSQQISGDFQTHWARSFLEQDYSLAPIDYLSADRLAVHQRLLLVQPRGFSPEENVALDEWVRAGGQLLLFADPWMTGYSRFGIADRRRPQGVTLLSNILTHWGLSLEYDPEQEAGVLFERIGDYEVPVNIPGRFVLADEAGVDEGADASPCAISETAILAQCAIGEGSVVILADAAMLDLAPIGGAREGFALLLARAFGENGENAGRAVSDRIAAAEIGGNPRFSDLENRPHSVSEPPG